MGRVRSKATLSAFHSITTASGTSSKASQAHGGLQQKLWQDQVSRAGRSSFLRQRTSAKLLLIRRHCTTQRSPCQPAGWWHGSGRSRPEKARAGASRAYRLTPSASAVPNAATAFPWTASTTRQARRRSFSRTSSQSCAKSWMATMAQCWHMVKQALAKPTPSLARWMAPMTEALYQEQFASWPQAFQSAQMAAPSRQAHFTEGHTGFT